MRPSPTGTGSVGEPFVGFDAFGDTGWVVDAAVAAGVGGEGVFVVGVEEGVAVIVGELGFVILVVVFVVGREVGAIDGGLTSDTFGSDAAFVVLFFRSRIGCGIG